MLLPSLLTLAEITTDSPVRGRRLVGNMTACRGGRTGGVPRVMAGVVLPGQRAVAEHCGCCATIRWWRGFESTAPYFSEMKR